MPSCCALIIDNRVGLEPIIEAHEKFIPKDWPVYWVKSEDTSTASGYNRLLTSKRLWRNLPDKVLIFQADSMLLRNGIEEFLQWDFIGAPIKRIYQCFNGGLSLRSSKVMMSIIDKYPYRGEAADGNEDIYFSNRLPWVGSPIPDVATASLFSVETQFALGSLGYHAIDKYLTPSECDQIRNQYNLVHHG